jgi:hypothetical protein
VNNQILDLKPKRQRKQAARVEIARSFSFKLNLRNYQSADFFQSAKSECWDYQADEVSDKLYAFCKTQVLKAVNEVKNEVKEGTFANGTHEAK